ncbi:MAG: GntR family transcriptional regulator [Paralcaligenes sp.]
MRHSMEYETTDPTPEVATSAIANICLAPTQVASTRYRAIYEDLAQGIRTGRFPVMTLLPTEHKLCGQYGASRHTVREAIRMLTEAGMVSRRRGVGTRVETDTPSTRYTQQISELADLFQYISNANLQIQSVSTIKVSTRLAKMLGCEPGRQWLRVKAIKLLGGHETPVAFSVAYIHLDYAAIRADIGKVRLPLSHLIEKRYSERIREVNQEFSAIPIKDDIAAALKVAPNTAGLVITRRYYGEHNRLMLATVATFPYKKMKYSMSLKLDV